jgi:hypothetical protein
MGAVFLSIRGIELVEYRRVRLRDRHALLDAAGGDAGVARGLGDAVPAASLPIGSPHVDVIIGSDDPDRSRLTPSPVAADRSDLDLLDCA